MVGTMLFVLGLAACIVGGLVCISMARSIKMAKKDALDVNRPPIDEKALWLQLKGALIDLYNRYETQETRRQRALRSWAGTLVICAGLCAIGMVLELEYRQAISLDEIFSGMFGPQRVAVPLAHPHAQQPAPQQSQPAPEANR